MSLKAMYNEIAGHYDHANRFGSISKSHQIALGQIQKWVQPNRIPYNILDLGVGDGAFLKKLYKLMPQAQYTGLDLSPEMLKYAKKNLPLLSIEGNAADAEKFLPPHSQDLVLAHFLNAYVPVAVLFQEAKMLTNANGYFSMITSTYDSFPKAQQTLAEFVSRDTITSRLVGHYYKSVVNNTTVAVNQTELLEAFESHDFTIVDHYRLKVPVTLQNIDELALFGIEGTWFLNTLSIRMLPKQFLINRLKRLFNKIFTFPHHDWHLIDVILAKK